MATRITQPERKDPDAKAAEEAARELDSIAARDRTATIAGRPITMREPTWLEALELDPGLQPVIADIEATIATATTTDWGELQRILYRHREVIMTMMGICAGVEPEWLVGLSDTDGQRLSTLFWEVNGPFFGRRVRMRRAAAVAAAVRAGPTSLKH